MEHRLYIADTFCFPLSSGIPRDSGYSLWYNVVAIDGLVLDTYCCHGRTEEH